MTERPGREVSWFLALTLALSAGFYAYVIVADAPRWRELQSAAFMWCPALAAIATQLALRRPLSELGLHWRRTTGYVLGCVAFPYLLAAPVYLAVWASGLGAFEPRLLVSALGRLGLGGVDPRLAFPVALLVAAPLGAFLGSLQTLGEELGWRGLLSPRLVAAYGLVKASLLTGLIWSAWHYPVAIALLPRFRPTVPVWYAMACFTLSVVGVSFFYTWLREASGSVWPAVLLHAASNGAQNAFEAVTKDTGATHYFTYEYGAGFVIVIWAAVGLVFRSWRAAPSEPRRPSG